MAFIAIATIGAGALSGGANIAGAVIQGNAARDAAQIQADAATHATDVQQQMYQQQRDDQAPWRQAGAGALSQLMVQGPRTGTGAFGQPTYSSQLDPSLTKSFGMADFQADPGYQFRLQQGQDALERSAAARGGLQSGGTLRALNDYAQGSASQEYQNAYNRFTNDQTNRFNRLSSVAGLGQTANGMTANAGMNFANNAGQNMMGAANARGAAGIAGANAWGSSLSNLGSLAGQGANTWMQYSMMNRMMNPGGGGFTPMNYSNAETGNPAGPAFADGGYTSSYGQGPIGPAVE